MPFEAAFGVCFSQRRAAGLGLDPSETLLALLIHLKPRFLRLPLYWDEIAPEPAGYQFEGIHWQLDQAQTYGSRVLLAVGIKGPGLGQYSVPSWLGDGLASAQAGAPAPPGRLAANLYLMLERTVALLADYDTIDAWQIEHEPFVTAKPGLSPPPISVDLVRREAEIVREVDSRHRPIVVNHRGGAIFSGAWRTALGLADIIGEDIGPPPVDTNYGGLSGLLRRKLSAPQTRLLALAAARRGKPLWITELSTEPAPAPPPATSEQISRGPLLRMRQAAALASRSGAQRVYLDGAEWWLQMRDRGDDRYWELGRNLLAQR